MLIVMEYRNVHDFLQAVFNIIAFGRGEILQVNTGKRRLQEPYRFNNFVRIFGIKADRYGINITKYFKQHRFAFHYRHCRFRTNIPQA